MEAPFESSGAIQWCVKMISNGPSMLAEALSQSTIQERREQQQSMPKKPKTPSPTIRSAEAKRILLRQGG
jgi:hypothetical protein